MSIWKTKTFYAGLALILTGVGIAVVEKDFSAAGQTILLGFATIFGRAAIAKAETK